MEENKSFYMILEFYIGKGSIYFKDLKYFQIYTVLSENTDENGEIKVIFRKVLVGNLKEEQSKIERKKEKVEENILNSSPFYLSPKMVEYQFDFRDINKFIRIYDFDIVFPYLINFTLINDFYSNDYKALLDLKKLKEYKVQESRKQLIKQAILNLLEVIFYKALSDEKKPNEEIKSPFVISYQKNYIILKYIQQLFQITDKYKSIHEIFSIKVKIYEQLDKIWVNEEQKELKKMYLINNDSAYDKMYNEFEKYKFISNQKSRRSKLRKENLKKHNREFIISLNSSSIVKNA